MLDITKYNNIAFIQNAMDGQDDSNPIHIVRTLDNNCMEFLFTGLNNFVKTFRTKDANQKWEIKPKRLIYNLSENSSSKPEPGQGYELFIPKEIISKYKDKTPIKSIVLTYQTPAAYFAAKEGIDCIGVPTWETWHNLNVTELLIDLFDIITVCQVESVGIIMDADLFKAEWKEGHDMAEKPRALYRVLERFKNVLRNYSVDLFWYYVHPDLITKDGTFLGLIEAYHDSPENMNNLISDFQNKVGPRKILVRQNITKMGLNQIKEEFAIHKDGAEFFERHRALIGMEEFVFNKQIYQYNLDTNKAEFVRSAEANSFINVGGTYYRKNVEYDEYKHIYPKLDRFPVSGFAAKFSHYSKEKIEKLKRDIPYFDKFGNLPEHINYESNWTVEDDEDGNLTRFYNTYSRISHKPVKGDCSLSLEFIKHVFGTHTILHKGQTIHGWELGLDYIKLLYERPLEFLPILCLISQEQKTGKSSFPEWMKAIFQENCIKVPAADVSGRFTSYFISKLLIYIEEALISKKEDVEKFKDLVVSTRGKHEEKGLSAVELSTFLKVILTSNNERSFAPIGDDDVRFWVRKLTTIPGGPKYDFKRKLYSEIPAFLYHLQDRPFVTEWEDRGWFHKALIHTEELSIIREASKSGNENLIREAIMNYMITHRLLWCELTLSDINGLIDEMQLPKSKISYYVTVVLGIPSNNMPHYYLYYQKTSTTTGETTEAIKRAGRTFTFLARDFFSASQIFNEYYIMDEESEQECTHELSELVKHEQLEKKRGVMPHNILAVQTQSVWIERVTINHEKYAEVRQVWDNKTINSFITLQLLLKKTEIETLPF